MTETDLEELKDYLTDLSLRIEKEIENLNLVVDIENVGIEYIADSLKRTQEKIRDAFRRIYEYEDRVNEPD